MLEFLKILLIIGPLGLILVVLCMFCGEQYEKRYIKKNKKEYIININGNINGNINENINENMNLLND